MQNKTAHTNPLPAPRQSLNDNYKTQPEIKARPLVVDGWLITLVIQTRSLLTPNLRLYFDPASLLFFRRNHGDLNE